MPDTPENINLLSQSSFGLVIDRIPNAKFFVTSVNIPDVTAGINTLSKDQYTGKVFGDKISFGDLNLTLLVDENLKSYEEVFNWMYEGIVTSSSPYDVSSDMSVFLMSSHNNVVKEFKFTDAFPYTIGSLSFNSTASSTTYATVDITFAFTNMEIS
jgi:hypothetical protein